MHGARFAGFGDEELREGTGPGVVIEIGSVYQGSCLLTT